MDRQGATLFAGLSASERATMLAIGPRWADDINRHREQVVAIYTPHLRAVAREGIEVDAGIAYGAHLRQRMDIYRQCGAPAKALPVLVFVHGGAFVRGSMNSNAEIYGNVPRYFARHGYLAVNLEYRLAPDAPHPAGAQDVALALAWLRGHAAGFGGDPHDIVLVGHSAGGAHAAAYVLDPELAALRGTGGALSALVLISARLRADVLPDNPNAAGVRAYWGDDETRHAQLSPLTHAASLGVPTLVVTAQFDNPHLARYGEQFHRRATAAGAYCDLLRVPGHNHTSVVAHLDTADHSLGPALLGFLGAARRAAPAPHIKSSIQE